MTAGIGHNSGNVGRIAGERLKSLVERIERLEEGKKGLADDIKDVFAEAKGTGFEPKIIRSVLRMRKKNAAAVRKEVEVTRLYLAALGLDFLD